MVITAQHSPLFHRHISDSLLNIVFGFVEQKDLVESEKVGRAWRDTVRKLGYNRLLEEKGIKKSETATSKRLYLLFLLQKVHSQIDLFTVNFKYVMSLPFAFDEGVHYFHLELRGNFAEMRQVIQQAISEMASSIQHSYAMPAYEMSFVEEDSNFRCFLQLKKSTMKIRLDHSETRFKQLKDREALLLQALSPVLKRRISPSKSDDQIFTLRKLQNSIAHIIGTFVRGAPKNRSLLS